METATPKIGYKEIFAQKEYMKSVIASVINRFGDSVDAIASTWIVYELTSNAMWSALIYGMNTLPTVLVTPFAGAFVEKRNKKTLMVITDLIRALCVAYIATSYLFGFLQAWHLILTTLIISTVEAFRTPANTAITPMILEEKYYDYGMSLSSSLGTVISLIGTGIAAGIIAFIGTSGAIYLDMITFILSALIISTIHAHESKHQTEKFDLKQYSLTLKEGMKYAFSQKTILLFCLIALFLNGIIVPLNSLQAPLISEVLGGGATSLSVMGISISLSMLTGSVLYPMIHKRVTGKQLCIFSSIGLACFYLGIVACRPFYTSELISDIILAVLIFILGFAVALINSFASVELIKRVEQDYLARVVALFTALTVAVNPVISFLLTGLTRILSTVSIFLIAGILAVIMTFFMISNKTLKEV